MRTKPMTKQESERKSLIARLKLTDEEVRDRRIATALDYKLNLDAAIRNSTNDLYSNDRVARAAQRFGFEKSELANQAIAFLIKAIVDSEVHIETLRRVKEEAR